MVCKKTKGFGASLEIHKGQLVRIMTGCVTLSLLIDAARQAKTAWQVFLGPRNQG